MKRAVLVVLVLAIGCASTGFHEGRTALRKEEQACLVAKKGAPKGVVFERFWTAPRLVAIGLVQWQEDRSWACPQAPADLLQAIRDELGRLNQQYRAGENISLAVTVYRFDKGAIWSNPTAHYELVARDPRRANLLARIPGTGDQERIPPGQEGHRVPLQGQTADQARQQHPAAVTLEFQDEGVGDAAEAGNAGRQSRSRAAARETEDHAAGQSQIGAHR